MGGTWTNLGPAKTKFTKRATKAKALIVEIQKILTNPKDAQFFSLIQTSYRKLLEFIASLTNTDSEALALIQCHPALSSTNEIRTANFVALTAHISNQGYFHLITEMEALLTTITTILKDGTQPLKTTCNQDHHIVTHHTVKLPSVASHTDSIDPEQQSYVSNHSNQQESPILRNDLYQFSPNVKSGQPLQHREDSQTEIVQNLLSRFMTELDNKIQTISDHSNLQFHQLHQVQKHIIQNMGALQANLAAMQDQMENPPSVMEHSYVKKPTHNDSEFKDESPPVSQHSPEQAAKSQKLFSPKQISETSPPLCSPIKSPSPTSPFLYQSQDITNILQTIKPFNGNPDEYSLFITRFTSLVHNSPNIDIIMKHNILISLLEDDAKELITSDDLSEEAYNNLRSNLEQVYNRSIDRRKQLIENYRKLEFHQTDYSQMERDVMKHICIANALQKNGITINDPFIIDTFVEKLPSAIMRTVLKRNRVRSLSFLENASLVQTLISDNKAVDEADRRKKERTQLTEVCIAETNHVTAQREVGSNLGNNRSNYNRAKPPPHKNTDQTVATTSTNSDKPRSSFSVAPCLFCTENHAARECKLSNKEKEEATRKQRRCLNCLHQGHQASSCKSRFSCAICKKRHNTAICLEQRKLEEMITLSTPSPQKQFSHSPPSSQLNSPITITPQHIQYISESESPSPNATITINLSLITDPEYTLPILQLSSPQGLLINALVDSGATTSIISAKAAQRLRCPIHEKKMITFKGFISATGPKQINFYKLEVRDKNGNIWSTIIPEYAELPTRIKPPVFSEEDKAFLQEQKINPHHLMNLNKFSGKPIDIIIGNNVLTNLLATSTRHILPSGRIVEDTYLGYITHPTPVPQELSLGSSTSANENKLLPNEAHDILTIETSTYTNPMPESGLWVETISQGNSIPETKLDQLLEQQSELEMLGIEPPPAVQGKKALNDELIQQFKSTAIRDEHNKVFVQFPFNGKEQHLNDNYLVAVKRLFSLLKQLKDIKDLQAYHEIICQQFESGIIEFVPDSEANQGPHYYIPHRVVEKLDSLTTKLRIVLDASSHMRNELSLNDCIFPGPSILKSILGILLRSRTQLYLLIADLAKAFHQVRLQSQHRNVTKFLWLKDPTKPAPPDNIITYRFTRLPFGITASPFLLAVTILLYMELNPHPINDKIKQNLYVDNVAFTPQTQEELLYDYELTKKVFHAMHMNCREFMCNDPDIMNQIPEADRAKSTKCKFLGHLWNAVEDTFTIKIAIPPAGKPTKKQLASFLASTYDPMGIVSPIMAPIKSLMSKVHDTTIKWKDQIPDNLMPEYEAIRKTFTEQTLTIPRQITPKQGFTKASLAIFSDASQEHYATSIYLCCECSDGTITSNLLFSKSKIRPKHSKNLTIPRLELLGLLIASNAAVSMIEELNIDISLVTFFCDNTSVLHWITHLKSLDKWVQNIVTSIQKIRQNLSEKNLHPTYRYVPTNLNPADIASRGATLAQLKNSTMWNHGPEFLTHHQSTWPKSLDNTPQDPKEFHCLVINSTPPTTEAPKAIDIQQTDNHSTYETIIPYQRTNSLLKLVTITQKVMRFIFKLVESHNKKHPHNPYIWKGSTMQQFAMASIFANEVTKRQISQRYIIRDHYLDAASRLDIHVPPSRDIQQDKDGVYHFSNSYVNKKHKNMPKSLIYILRKHPLATLITLDSHQSLLHQGPKDTARDINQKYWISKITSLTRKVRKQCITCKRLHGRPYLYPFATSLPAVRTQTYRPFQHIGLDYFGPISYRTATNNTGKLWVMLTTCLLTRAVHLEVVPDNTTKSFLLAMRRHIGRRGTSRTILSDNAPAFSLGYSMMNTDIVSMINSSQTLTSYLASKDIEVKQITPFAPWQGGIYERIVAIVKNMLHKTIGRLQLSYIEIETLIIECEGIINSRPITRNPISISDTEAVRPIDFLLPQAELSIPNHNYRSLSQQNNKIGITEKQTREYLKHLDTVRLHLWDEFYNEMYTSIKTPKYRDKVHSTSNPKPNQMVLVETANVPRYRWPLGRILELLPSNDGKIRSVRLKCKNHIIERAINQLIPLELPDETSRDM